MWNRPTLAAFASLLIALSAAPATAATPGEADACRIVAPRYEPKARSAPTEAVRLTGGAKLSRPVAAPCPPSQRPVAA